ncbi:MAG: PIG-L family deacetylase [Chloroflexi bacterium]|nr:PIG-L family deacetylase [Chloroflexota bacterium]
MLYSPTMTQEFDHLYLSPHLDDAVLSCGGTIHYQVCAGQRVLVVTFFTASPADPAFTPHSRELFARWNRGDDPVAIRRQEDRRALSLLGAEALHLDFLDAVYRTDAQGSALYPEKGDIFAPLHPQEEGWSSVLLAAFLRRAPVSQEVEISAPLGAGRHVDHLLIREVALKLLQAGYRVRFYEDYPYTGDAEAVRRGMAPYPTYCWKNTPQPLGPADLAAKKEAVACYVSQISTFWPDEPEMRRALAEHAWRVAELYGVSPPAENYWHLDITCIHEG